jgi:hypothetical protein
MIDRAIKARKEKLEKSQDLLVDMRPEFVDALKSAVAFSRMYSDILTSL